MKGLRVALMVLIGVLAMAQQSMQISLKNTQKINAEIPPFALILTSSVTEKALNESSFFTHGPYVDILGRRFVTGFIYGSPVVYVISASTRRANIGESLQRSGVISVGAAGTTNETISIGSVVVPRDIAFTGLKGSSSDIYVNNPAYREFLYKSFGASTVDTASAAAGLGALTNDLKFIAIQGVSNKAGAGSDSNATLANENAVKALVRFIFWVTIPREEQY